MGKFFANFLGEGGIKQTKKKCHASLLRPI
jgi:hypothetical protein